MPNYGLLNDDTSVIGGIAEGLRSGLMGFRQARKDINDDQQQALENQMKKKMYGYDLAKSGLQETTDSSGNFTYSTSPQELEKEKRIADEKRATLKFQSELTSAEDRRKERATFQRAIQAKLAERNMLAQFDERGSFTGAKPMMGLMQPTDSLAPGAGPINGVNEGLMRQMIDTRQIPKEEGNKTIEEYGKYGKLKNELEEADRVFDTAKENATFRGRVSRGINPHAFAAAGGAGGAAAGGLGTFGLGLLPGIAAGTAAGEGLGQGIKGLVAYGDEPTKAYRSAVDPFIDKLTKDTAGRVTPISFEKISAVMPEQGDSEKVLMTKKAALHNLIKTSQAFPNLKMRGLLKSDDPILKLDSGDISGSQAGTLTPDEQKEFERLDAKFGKRK